MTRGPRRSARPAPVVSDRLERESVQQEIGKTLALIDRVLELLNPPS